MMTRRASLLSLASTALFTVLLTASVAAESRSIFNGTTLAGWKAPDMRYWSVKDGAITAQSSDEMPCKQNQFLVWQGGDLDDFNLSMKFRISGAPSANSGVQIRSQIAPDGHASGYQADLDLAGRWRGALYDEHMPRRLLAAPGQKTVIAADGTRKSVPIPGAKAKFDADGWNEYRIIARGSRITVMVNGTLTSDVTDEETKHRDLFGKLAIQIHSGPPMTVQFKDIHLERLPLTKGRKKTVLIAGRPSHGSGQHEHNAGIKLLAKRLRTVPGMIATEYHDRGWPKDPSAFDNADAVVIYADGGGGHPLNAHLEQFEALAKRGVGLMCIHYGVEVPVGRSGDAFKRWIGGHYEHKFSSNPHWNADLKINSEHPIGRGVKATKILDEWYFSIRFRDGRKGVQSILTAKPSDKTRSKNGYPPKPYPHIIAQSGKAETLMWAVEREDGGRGVGFTGGHFHRNWAHDTQRRAVLNAMMWVAGATVPKGGVDSEAVSVEELNADLDKKRGMKKIALPDGL
jgi:hypothetical protein